MKNHTVKQGDCISSIADENGFFWETIWNDPGNKDLKELRKDPNILFPNDNVVVPDKKIKEVSEPTNEVHKYKLKNSPARLKLRILKEGKPRGGEPFILFVDGKEKSRGTIPSDGNINITIPPNAKNGELTVGKSPDEEIFKLNLGYLDPIDTLSGVKARLLSLGFDCGSTNNEMGEETIDAIADFQAYINHPDPNGNLDDKTREALGKLHDELGS